MSHTSILNAIEEGAIITWQPEAFLAFATTLAHAGTENVDRAFDLILWGLAESGIDLLSSEKVVRVFGDRIEQATINIVEQRQLYEANLQTKYGEPLESVLQRVQPIERPLAAIQIASEIAQAEMKRREYAEAQAASAERRAKVAEAKLKELDRFRQKMEAKKQRGRRRSKKQKSQQRSKR